MLSECPYRPHGEVRLFDDGFDHCNVANTVLDSRKGSQGKQTCIQKVQTIIQSIIVFKSTITPKN
jgi:hypothetical protein